MFIGGVVTLYVSDFGRSFRFYTETLGFTERFRAGEHWAEVEGAGMTLGLHPAGEQTPRAGESDSLSLGFRVADVESARAELEGRGVAFMHALDDGNVKLAFFQDPDGHSLYLYQTAH